MNYFIEKIFIGKKYLSPASRLGEILFGLIMVLTFTLIAGIAIKEKPGAASELLIATVGCNIAWGIIDAIFYLMTSMLERMQRRQTVLAIQKAPTETDAIKIIADRLDDSMVVLTTAADREYLYQNILKVAKQLNPKKIFLTKDDVMGAIASGWLVIATTFPAVIPFFFIQKAHLALRVSNLILIALLFLAGCCWAKYANTNTWITGLIFMIIGIVLVSLAIALGG